jgi:hypothetical protein
LIERPLSSFFFSFVQGARERDGLKYKRRKRKEKETQNFFGGRREEPRAQQQDAQKNPPAPSKKKPNPTIYDTAAVPLVKPGSS